jgi:hypothetical protein
MKTIGEILKRGRERKKLTLDDVQRNIKIQVRFIKALEDDNYEVFSGVVHAKGFLKIYISYLGLNENEILAIWRREYEKDIEKKTPKKKVIGPLPKNFGVFFSPSSLISAFSVLLVVFFFFYLFSQYRDFTGSPTLEIYFPRDGTVSDSPTIDIVGKTDVDSTVYLNGQQLILSTDGSFATSFKLNEGLNSLGFLARNKFDKKTELVRTIIYRKLPEIIQVKEATPSSEKENGL